MSPKEDLPSEVDSEKVSSSEPSSEKPDPSKKIAGENPGEKTDGQLFFSTDGEELPSPKENPYDDVDKETSKAGTEETKSDSSDSSERRDTDSNQKNRANPKAPSHNPSRGNRKQNWQEKNKGKPRQRQ